MKDFLYKFYLILSLCFFFSCASRKQSVSHSKSSVQNSQNINLETEIKKWIDVPYKFGGNSKNGIDCSGFVQTIYEKVYQIKLPRTTEEMFKISKPVLKKNLREGDLVFFNTTRKTVSHVGIFIKENSFVHASSSKGVVISLLTNSYYQKHFIGGGRVN